MQESAEVQSLLLQFRVLSLSYYSKLGPEINGRWMDQLTEYVSVVRQISWIISGVLYWTHWTWSLDRTNIDTQ